MKWRRLQQDRSSSPRLTPSHAEVQTEAARPDAVAQAARTRLSQLAPHGLSAQDGSWTPGRHTRIPGPGTEGEVKKEGAKGSGRCVEGRLSDAGW